MHKTCVFKGIGDLYATHSKTVCTNKKTCLYIENSCILSAYAAWMCLTQQMAMASAKKCHKEPFSYQCMFEAAVSTAYILRTCDNALAYWLKLVAH